MTIANTPYAATLNLEMGQLPERAPPEPASTYNARLYTSVSDCCNNVTTRITDTAERIYSWATHPNTRIAFALLTGSALCGLASIACGSAYSDCQETDSAECNKETTRTRCSKNDNGSTHCTTTTTTYEEDLLNTSIGLAAASVFCLGAGLYKLCNQDD